MLENNLYIIRKADDRHKLGATGVKRREAPKDAFEILTMKDPKVTAVDNETEKI